MKVKILIYLKVLLFELTFVIKNLYATMGGFKR